MLNKKKILIYGDSPLDGYPSYADTINEICKLLKDTYEIYIIAYSGAGFHKNEIYTVLPNIRLFTGSKNALFIPENIEYYSNIIHPDVILVHTDTNLFVANLDDRKYIKEFIETSKIPFFLYAVIDGIPIPQKDRDFFNIVNKYGKVITFSNFAHEAYKNSEYIPHGVDLEYFKPLENREELRTKCGIRKDDIVIGFVGSCTTRKQPFRFLNLIKRLQSEYGDKIKCIFNINDIPVIKEYIYDNNIKIESDILSY
jgi:glycosyltransferase involved in cell wall biosynthesis